MQGGEVDVAQRNAVEGIGADDHVIADLMTGGLHRGEIGKLLVVQLDAIRDARAGYEVGNGVVTVTFDEAEEVVTRAAGQPVVASSADESVNARPAPQIVREPAADQRVIAARAIDVGDTAHRGQAAE